MFFEETVCERSTNKKMVSLRKINGENDINL